MFMRFVEQKTVDSEAYIYSVALGRVQYEFEKVSDGTSLLTCKSGHITHNA